VQSVGVLSEATESWQLCSLHDSGLRNIEKYIGKLQLLAVDSEMRLKECGPV